MGYNLTIGDLVVEYDNDPECPHVTVSAKGARSDDAPAFGEPTDQENQRWPSYTGWSNFVDFVGLRHLFHPGGLGAPDFDYEKALIQTHPGCVPVTQYHKDEVDKAMASFVRTYPDAKPTYGRPAPEGEDKLFWVDEENPRENSQMVRLVWLQYWINWALENCEKPVFENT